MPQPKTMTRGIAGKVAIIAIGLILATLAALQCLSMVFTSRAPDLALDTWPMNGRAKAQKAVIQMSAEIPQTKDIQLSARHVRPLGLAAYRDDPLLPASLAILILSTPNGEAKNTLIENSLKLNRRDLTLQGLALERAVTNDDIPAIVNGIDQILRVHQSSRSQMYPLLADAMQDSRSLPVMVSVMKFKSPWQIDFLRSMARDAKYSTRLLQIRELTQVDDDEFDRRLLSSLARENRFDEAGRVFADGRSFFDTSGDRRTLGWSDALSPFGWSLANESNFRALISPDGSSLHVSVGNGRSGLVARRVFPVSRAFQLEIPVENLPSGLSAPMSAELRCAVSGEIIAKTALGSGSNRLAAGDVPPDCRFVQISLMAKVGMLDQRLEADVQKITIR